MRIPGVVGKSTEFNVDIFSSETGKWSQSASVCPCGFDWGVFAFPPPAFPIMVCFFGGVALTALFDLIHTLVNAVNSLRSL